MIHATVAEVEDEVLGSAKGELAPAETVRLEHLSATDWDDLVGEFDDIFHEQIAMFNLLRWGEKRCEFIQVRRNEQIIGGACIIVLTVPMLNAGLAILKWGPVWRRQGEEADPKNLELILQAVKQEYAVERKLYLTVMPRADADYQEITPKTLNMLGFRRGKKLPAPARYLVKTGQTDDELRKSLSQKWRYNLKKAEKNNFSHKILPSSEGIEPFMELYEIMLERKGFSDHSAIYTLRDYVAKAPAHLQPKFVFTYYEGEACAAGVIDVSGECAIYLYGATNDRALGLRAGYAMHWEVVKMLCADPKSKWYDLGGNDLDNGLHQFKSGFVGKTGVQCDCPESYHYGKAPLSCLIGKSVFAAREAKHALSQLQNRIPQLKSRLGSLIKR
ncbi:lipid II:glycine glycyltransferase FemX [Coralliovum pocilloporae]|uniref:lipid II:glycine glycyltransferase FemX n=1 Tax=Coralliovum pocilloporae TaxID=3066369 RepID=UPI00330792D6